MLGLSVGVLVTAASACGADAAGPDSDVVVVGAVRNDQVAAVVRGPAPSTMSCPTLDAASGLVLELSVSDGDPVEVALDALDPGELPDGARIERTPEVLVELGPAGVFVASVPQLEPAADCLDGDVSSIEQALLDDPARPAAVGVSLDGVVTEIELPVDPTTWNVLPDAHLDAAEAWAEGG